MSINKSKNFITFLDNYSNTSQLSYPDYSTLLYQTTQEYNMMDTNLESEFNCYVNWQKKHNLDISIKKDTAKKNKHKKKSMTINTDIHTLNDLVVLIDTNPYDEDTEYNIDLKQLHDIQNELKDLNNMVGLEELKTSVLNQLFYFIQNLHIGENNSDYKHTVLFGPPGTGKTEIAKIIGKLYSKIGVLTSNKFKKVTRNDLIAGYLGQTAIKTKKVISECLGGVLFIDEAYSLINKDQNDSFSQECIDVLCEALSDHKNDLMVIIAGYEDELENTFFKANRGLESRFIWRFKIDSYNSKELLLIFTKMVQDQGWKLEPGCINDNWFEQHIDTFKHFGRDIEIFLTNIKISHGRRIYGNNNNKKLITSNDIQNGYENFVTNRKKKDQQVPSLYSMYC
uniref:AAA+ ATPase domain-containing protein n=1 Tax=viral metagenome TaxID=1070528 RepID=A0A6C0IP86_9ZZZZ